MGDLSKNLSRWEMTCRCGCGFDTVDAELVKVLQDVVDHFNVGTHSWKTSLIITGPNRCKERNNTEGGSTASQHLKGRAADFKLSVISYNDVADYLEKTYPNKYGIGRYNGRTHIDTRSNGPARWDNRQH